MRRTILAGVLMMTLSLTGCGGAGGGKAEELALAVRGTYLGMEGCTAQVTIEADYGQRVYTYQGELVVEGETMALTLTQPELVAGLTARMTAAEGTLEFDGVSVETGPLDGEGLTPVSALPALLEAARSGYMTACLLEEEGGEALLRVECGAPDGKENTGRTVTLWFDPDSHALVRGETAWDGVRTVGCTLEEFTMAAPDTGEAT